MLLAGPAWAQITVRVPPLPVPVRVPGVRVNPQIRVAPQETVRVAPQVQNLPLPVVRVRVSPSVRVAPDIRVVPDARVAPDIRVAPHTSVPAAETDPAPPVAVPEAGPAPRPTSRPRTPSTTSRARETPTVRPTREEADAPPENPRPARDSSLSRSLPERSNTVTVSRPTVNGASQGLYEIYRNSVDPLDEHPEYTEATAEDPYTWLEDNSFPSRRPRKAARGAAPEILR